MVELKKAVEIKIKQQGIAQGLKISIEKELAALKKEKGVASYQLGKRLMALGISDSALVFSEDMKLLDAVL